MSAFSSLLDEVRACTRCAAHLPLGPRPILQLHPKARILIAGQAPGRKAHATGLPFDDASGNRLREWLGVTREVFYDPEQIAILPMGFCFPGPGRGETFRHAPSVRLPGANSFLRRFVTLSSPWCSGSTRRRITSVTGACLSPNWSGHGTPIGPTGFRCRIPVRETPSGCAGTPGSSVKFSPRFASAWQRCSQNETARQADHRPKSHRRCSQ